jgi:hypothetical protein
MACLLIAPRCVAATLPSLKIISVGMPRTPVFRAGHRVFVDIDLGDFYLAGHLLGDGLQMRRHLLARAAPFSPEIHNNGDIGIGNDAVELIVCYIDRGHGELLIIQFNRLLDRDSRYKSNLAASTL